jgi:peptidoglycan/LPS O-acetylase OafA/YrhL
MAGTATPTRPTRREPRADAAPDRLAWIDNLRVVVIVGVVGAHVGQVYALDVGWYYEERTASGVFEGLLAAVFAPGLLFGMGLLFLVAGLFTPPSFDRKGAGRFLADRGWRLAVPSVVYFFAVNPAMDYLGAHAEGTGESLDDYFRRTYLDDVGFGIAWFIFALFVFSVGYAAWRSRHPARTEDAGPLPRRDVIRVMVFVAVASYAVRLAWPFLDTDVLGGMNLWEYPQMVALFVLGVLARERGWLTGGLPADVRRACGRAALLGLALAVPLAVGITFVDDADPFLGGLRLEATLIPVVEAMITVGTSLWAVDWFGRRWNRATPLVRAAGRGSFVAYVVHAPILVLLAVLLRDVGVPAEVKYVVVFALTVVAAFGVGWLLDRRRRAQADAKDAADAPAARPKNVPSPSDMPLT